VGALAAMTEIPAIKVVAPNVLQRVVDDAIQIHGGGGMSDDFPLAQMYALQRAMRIFDGPDEVHKRTVAQRELRKYEPAHD
jgi:acyl-CoA dehydrogenase